MIIPADMEINIRAIKCAYCGDLADTRDHVIPVSYLRHRNYSSTRQRFARGDWTVPACGDCNNKLQDELLLDVPSRAGYLLKKNKRKWSKIINAPDWRAEEIAELEGEFREQILNLAKLKAYHKARIRHLESVSLMDDDYLRPDAKSP